MVKEQRLPTENGILYFWSILSTLLAFGRAWSERFTTIINTACEASFSQKSQIFFPNYKKFRSPNSKMKPEWVDSEPQRMLWTVETSAFTLRALTLNPNDIFTDHYY